MRAVAVGLAVTWAFGGVVCAPDMAPAAAAVNIASDAATPRAITLPPVAARFDYQIGGAYAPARGVRIIDRDWHQLPAPGIYSICYVNAFQAQPEELAWWRRHHRSLLLHDSRGREVVDSGWNEVLFDVRTPARRALLAGIVGGWMRTCAIKGFRAVEPDNLDSYTRSARLLRRSDAVAYSRLLIGRAHALHLAIAQKNDTHIAALRVGFDFAIAEECHAYKECGAYTKRFGRHVIEIEYPDNGGSANLRSACRVRGRSISIEYRDRDVLPAGRRGHVARWC